jgi:hypothetical protein
LIKKVIPKDGTTNLLEHVNACQRGKMDPFGSLTTREKTDFTRAFTMFCAQDLRPMKSAKGKGLINLVQTAIDLQFSRKTRINAKELVPDPTTVSRNLPKIEETVKKEIKSLLHKNTDENRPAFTLDLWEDIKKEVNNYFLLKFGLLEVSLSELLRRSDVFHRRRL